MEQVTAARERLIAAHVYMRYDYAWKTTEFQQCSHRMTGVVCRLLYLYERWQYDLRCIRAQQQATPQAAETSASPLSLLSAPFQVFVDANGYAPFQERVEEACARMEFEVLTDERAKERASLVFIYVPPPGEAPPERADRVYSSLETVTAHHNAHATPMECRPVFCFLSGEAEFLDPPATAEVERLRGLSGFAISQQLVPKIRDVDYVSIAHFAAEFTPQGASISSESAELAELTGQFGCMDHNLMHETEKWQLYAPKESLVCRWQENDEEIEDDPVDDEDVRYWLEATKGKTCDACYAINATLSRCARCGDAFYCSRECQRAAWKMHKPLCTGNSK